jgi:hypothetical protein
LPMCASCPGRSCGLWPVCSRPRGEAPEALESARRRWEKQFYPYRIAPCPVKNRRGSPMDTSFCSTPLNNSIISLKKETRV